jgi:FkbM family methyltransferase
MKRKLKRALERMPPRWRTTLRRLLVTPLRAYFRYMPGQTGKDALWRGVAAHLWWLEGTVTARTVSGDLLAVDARDTVGRYIYYFGTWEPNLTAWLQRSLRPGDVFVDVGANVGYFTLLASRLVGPDGRVVAIEALPEIHTVLERNVRANDARNVRAACVAAWNEDAALEMFTRVSGGPTGTSTAYASWATRWDLAPAATVTARPLPDILDPGEIERARIIKIDAEGAEWRVIAGLAGVLPHCRDDLEIVVELAPGLLREDGASPDDIARLLGEHGFRPYRLENDYDGSAYYGGNAARRPTRIAEFPSELEQFDVVFSRSDAPVL